MDVLYQGVIQLSPTARKVAHTAVVQRLKHVSQLGFGLPFISRWEHSVGVAHLSRIAGETLQVEARDVLRLELAGLLHDCGHGPFSHTFDKHFLVRHPSVMHKEHEDRSVLLVPMALEGISELDGEDVRWVQHMIRPSKIQCPDPQKAFLGTIVANPYHGIDTDKLDYLGRDVIHLCRHGLLQRPLDNIDPTPVIRSIRATSQQILFSEDHRSWIEDKSRTRLWMYKNVYLAPSVIQAQDQGVAEVLEPYKNKLLGAADSMAEFLQYHDGSFGPLPHFSITLSENDSSKVEQHPDQVLPLVSYYR